MIENDSPRMKLRYDNKALKEGYFKLADNGASEIDSGYKPLPKAIF